MSQAQNQNRFLFPFYIKVLLPPINRAQELLQLGTGEQAWISVKVLVIGIREQDERQKLDIFIKDVEDYIDNERARHTYTKVDSWTRALHLDQHLRKKALELYDKTMKVFEDKGYFKAVDTLPTGQEINY